MLIPRQTQLANAPPLRCFHLWSRMAPGLALLDSADLKTWAQKLLQRLAQSHAVEVQAFALEAGRIHLVLRWRPEDAAAWDDAEASRRWRLAHPPRMWQNGKWATGATEGGAGQPSHGPQPDAAAIRAKLGSLSMFMKHFKQLLTHRINRQSGRKGTVWQGRFHMAPLADAGAVAGTMAFVDLRRAVEQGGERPEAQPFTSIHVRVGRHRAMLGMDGADLPAQNEAQVFGPEVAQPLRDATAPEQMAMPTNPGMPPVEMPGMGGMPMPPMMMPATPAGAMGPGDAAGTPAPAFNAPWLIALREDGPRAVLAGLSLPRYLKLLDALVAKAKAWPHLPADAPGRARAPETPAWENTLESALGVLGINAAAFEAQWKRLATLRG